MDGHPGAVERFSRDIVDLHGRLTFEGLPEAVRGEPVHRHDSGDGLLTLAFRDSQLPQRYLLGLHGFRLAQYLRLGWVCEVQVHQRALFHEPMRPRHGQEDVHVVCLCLRTGRIQGYAALAGSRDPEPLPLDAPERRLLAVEKDHRVRLLDPCAEPGLTTHHIYEAKRLLRDQAMPRGDLAARVPWHVLLAWGQALWAAGGGGHRALVAGDAKERGSLRHLRLMGFRLDVVEGTAPSLPRTDLLWPIFESAEVAKPFVGRMPDSFPGNLEAIAAFLDGPPGARPVAALIEELSERTLEPGRTR